MEIEDGIPKPSRSPRLGVSKADLLRSLKPGQSLLIPSREEANVMRATAHKVLGAGKVTVLRVDGGWRLWRE